MEKQPESPLFLTFRVKGQLYGVTIHAVIEINREFNVTPIPQTPDYVLGFVNLRGRVVPIVDLRRRFGMGASEKLKESCVVIIKGPNGPLGVWVDAVCEVVEIPPDKIDGAPAIGTRESETLITGMAHLKEEVAILLDLAKILSADIEIPLPDPDDQAA